MVRVVALSSERAGFCSQRCRESHNLLQPLVCMPPLPFLHYLVSSLYSSSSPLIPHFSLLFLAARIPARWGVFDKFCGHFRDFASFESRSRRNGRREDRGERGRESFSFALRLSLVTWLFRNTSAQSLALLGDRAWADFASAPKDLRRSRV